MDRKKRSNIKTLLAVVIFFASIMVIGLGSSFFSPDISILKTRNPKTTAFMEFRKNEWKTKGLKKKISRKWVPLSRISPFLIHAVTISEDDKFWDHEGFDLDAMREAFERDIEKKRFKFGGSTITQQLVKNLYLSSSKNPVRKIREAILTLRVENTLSKRRILELYLNLIEWGDGIFGIEAASRYYFGKSAYQLDPYEAIRLAVILPNPRKLNPLGNSEYISKRSRDIYAIMVKRGIITEF